MEIRLHAQLIALAAACLLANSAPGETAVACIKQFPLDERTVYEIAIGRDVPTTLMFPSALTAIEGANVTTSAETTAPVMLAYTPGQNFLSVRALEKGAKGAINIVWKQRTFVIRLSEGAEPFGSVSFFYEDIFAGHSRTLQKRVSPEVIVGLLDRAKAFGLTQQQYPEVVQQIEHVTPGNVCYYRGFRVTVDEVFRFDPEDTLVFKLRFANDSSSPIYYQPQRLAARVGVNVYYPSIADASGIVPPKAVTTAYFAITGSAAGGRANLSVKNNFSIVVTRVERDVKLIVPE